MATIKACDICGATKDITVVRCFCHPEVVFDLCAEHEKIVLLNTLSEIVRELHPRGSLKYIGDRMADQVKALMEAN